MKRTYILCLLLLLIPFFGQAQQAVHKPAFSAILDSSLGNKLLRQCSRATPAKVKGFWQVSQSDINTLEQYYAKLDALKATGCCLTGGQVMNPGNYGVQYVGVVIGKHKYIYINAFIAGEIDLIKKYQTDFDPAKNPVIVCDGGWGFWGALFDIETKTFSELSFNGIG